MAAGGTISASSSSLVKDFFTLFNIIIAITPEKSNHYISDKPTSARTNTPPIAPPTIGPVFKDSSVLEEETT